jgi:hypothetical protein
MSETMEELRPARPAEIQGLVDNITADRLYGWAWIPGRPEDRVAIELRIKDEEVATAIADRTRPDLARAGIGDGRHAFEIPLQPAWAKQVGDMVLIARTPDGTEAPLPIRVRRADLDPNGALQRVLEATATAHRQLREELERIHARLPPETPDHEALLRRLGDGQGELNERLDSLTLWLTRLDEKLAVLPDRTTASLRRRMDPWQFLLGVVLAAVFAGAGLATLAHLLPLTQNPPI